MDNIKIIADRYAEAKTRYDLVTAELEAKLAAIKQEYASQLVKLEEELQETGEQLKHFADQNPEEVQKSGFVKFGYRWGRERLEVKNEQELASILLRKGYNELIRHKVELDKVALLKKCSNDQYFADVYGINIVRERKFFIDIIKA